MSTPAATDDPSHLAAAGAVPVTVAALGVVYGDIGTSPLYAYREAFSADAVDVSTANALGIASLIFWSLTIVVTVKYLIVVLRADNDGEGGILSLTVLALGPPSGGRRRGAMVIAAVGLFGTALLYGDGVITPAISVLSAVEGAEVAAPELERWVIPVAVAILAGLFAFQNKGTGAVGKVFGPVMAGWFALLAVLGVSQIAHEPSVVRGLSPTYAATFFADNGTAGFLVLGSVFLVVTGGEALYADLGHFGPRPIRAGWFAVVFPALVLNYFGQAALLIDRPDAVDSPFFRMAPGWSLYPLTIVATMATVIASQALISGVFSLTTQAMRLGYLPRVRVLHTSATAEGQVYVPVVNWTLMTACIVLVVTFGSSSSLAAAYGVAVTMTMLITTALFVVLAHRWWHWPAWQLVPLGVALLTVDAAFLGANLFKIPSGGWLPLVLGAAMYAVLTTWHRGRELTAHQLSGAGLPLERFVRSLEQHPPTRVRGTAVYLIRTPGTTPPTLILNLRHQQVLHDRVVVVSIVTDRVPRVPRSARIELDELGAGFHQATLHYGFMERPDVDADLTDLWTPGLDFDAALYVVGKDAVEVTDRPGMARWREHLFRVLTRNSSDVVSYFGLPLGRTEEIGLHVEI